MVAIDLNSDLGESYGVWTVGDDRAMLDIVTSANVACGFHAGDPSGNWMWTQIVRGVERPSSLTLILKGKRVVGHLSSPGLRGEHTGAELMDGTFEDDVVSFRIERDLNGQKVITKFRGRVLGNFITGTYEVPGVTGLAVEREWIAKRVM